MGAFLASSRPAALMREPRKAVFFSFLRHTENAATEYGLDSCSILVELGRHKMEGGQEDMIVDVAPDLTST
jgi:hypothetical protein